MQRLYFTLSILVLTSLLAGCAPSANAQADQVKASHAVTAPLPTDPPERATSEPADNAKSEVVPHDPPASCPVTVPQDPPFSAPAPYSPNAPWSNIFWFGSEHLWTALPADGIWSSLPHNPAGYTQKVVWWSEGYIWNEEPEPALTVTGERLDASAPPLITSEANGVYASDMGSAMMAGSDFPTLGCWKITGQYKKTELSFVVWLAP